MSDLERLFNRFKMAEANVQHLSAVVQNEGMTVTGEEMDRWRTEFHEHMAAMQNLANDVLKHYNR